LAPGRACARVVSPGEWLIHGKPERLPGVPVPRFATLVVALLSAMVQLTGLVNVVMMVSVPSPEGPPPPRI
jgi:hypothetical protein